MSLDPWPTAPGLDTGGGGGGGGVTTHNLLSGRTTYPAHDTDALAHLPADDASAVHLRAYLRTLAAAVAEASAGGGLQRDVTVVGTDETVLDETVLPALAEGAPIVPFNGPLAGPAVDLTPSGAGLGAGQWQHPATLPVGVDSLHGIEVAITGDLDGLGVLAVLPVNTGTGELLDGHVLAVIDGALVPYDNGALVGMPGKALLYNPTANVGGIRRYRIVLDEPVVDGVPGLAPDDIGFVVVTAGAEGVDLDDHPIEARLLWGYTDVWAIESLRALGLGLDLEVADDGTVGVRKNRRDHPTATAGFHSGFGEVDALVHPSGWPDNVFRIDLDAAPWLTWPIGNPWIAPRVANLSDQATEALNGWYEILTPGAGGQAPDVADLPGYTGFPEYDAENLPPVAVVCPELSQRYGPNRSDLFGGTVVTGPGGIVRVTQGDGLDKGTLGMPGLFQFKKVAAVASDVSTEELVIVVDNDGSEPSVDAEDWDVSGGPTQQVVDAATGWLYDLEPGQLSVETDPQSQLNPLPTLFATSGLNGQAAHGPLQNAGQWWWWTGHGPLVRLPDGLTYEPADDAHWVTVGGAPLTVAQALDLLAAKVADLATP